MLSTRDIKRKIRTVRSIEQITQAMRTVSSIKLRRAEQRIRAARPYADELRTLLGRMAAGGVEHPYLTERPVEHTGVVAISSDKGLAGSFNANVIRAAIEQSRELPGASLVTLGRRVSDTIRRLGLPTEGSLSPMGAEPQPADVGPIADLIGELYRSGRWDRVVLVYTRFGGGTKIDLTTRQILPLERPEGVPAGGDYIYEPPADRLLSMLMPRYLRTVIYTAVLDSVASEHAARMVAMTAATDNAEEMIDSLTLEYNKARQAAITKELIDIVGAAEALT